jgi:UDP-N-acetylmuramate--alanine ligase
MTNTLTPAAHIHILGIGGFGMNPIARVMHQMGYTVSGCDRDESALIPPLREMGIDVHIGHDPAHLDAFNPDALVISSAVTPDNPEVQAARARDIPVFKRADILGVLMADRFGIAVAGTHGKTTTTAMIAHMLSIVGRDPTFIIGGISRDLGTNARAGQGTEFVIEADEYDRMFLGLRPKVIVLTSLEHDHPDMFGSIDDVRALFAEFVDLLPTDGLLIACFDDKEVRRMIFHRLNAERPTLMYGNELAAEFNSSMFLEPNASGGTDFRLSTREEQPDGAFIIGSQQVSLQVPGDHNVQNALAALAVAHTLGIPLDQAAAALSTFTGTGRRFEVKGTARGVTVIDDYAHHPTAIRATLQGARARYGNATIWAVWQPHTFSRTKALLDDFAAAFTDADHVLITDIYRSRDTEDYGITPQTVIDLMPGDCDAQHIATLDAVTSFLAEHVTEGDVVIVMSAGDATRIGGELLTKLTEEG